MGDQKNFLMAIVLSMGVLLIWQQFFVKPQMDADRARLEQEQRDVANGEAPIFEVEAPNAGDAMSDSSMPGGSAPALDTSLVTGLGAGLDTVAEARVSLAIETPRLTGSVSLRGARIDDLVFEDYNDKVGEGAKKVEFLIPAGQPGGYYSEFGWIGARGTGLSLPNARTVWQASGKMLTPNVPVVLSHDNGEGLRFQRTISVDGDYVFTIRDRIENSTAEQVSVAPFAMIVREGTPDVADFFTLHEGPIGVFDGKLSDNDLDYSEVRDETQKFSAESGWIGIVDKYWMAALIPAQGNRFNAQYRYNGVLNKYDVGFLNGLVGVPAGGAYEVEHHFFAGAKEVDLIDKYSEELGVPGFQMAIDWGWYPFLTKPIFWGLDFFYGLIGNFGVAILLLTVLIKLALFPLANKGYVSMSKMKKLQPKMKELQERFKDDKARQQQELMALYKKEKANPLAGCLPILVQIPVFFALYKTLFMSIEMRHQPFFGWVHDLSAPDPATILTLFGLVPWEVPSFLAIGIWPVIMGGTMFLQQKLNPQSPDPVQAKMMMFLPLLFTFILAPFPVGLVIYWTWNNILSIAQQWTIMHRMGVKVGD